MVRLVFCSAGGVGEDGGVEGSGGAGNWRVGRARSSPRGHLPEGQRGADQQQAQSGREDSPAGAAGEYPTATTLYLCFFACASNVVHCQEHRSGRVTGRFVGGVEGCGGRGGGGMLREPCSNASS